VSLDYTHCICVGCVAENLKQHKTEYIFSRWWANDGQTESLSAGHISVLNDIHISRKHDEYEGHISADGNLRSPSRAPQVSELTFDFSFTYSETTLKFILDSTA
jgi:hypothetical protein